jgi:hypothetical protein
MSDHKKLSLFVFVDAFGWEIFQQHPKFLEGELQTTKPLTTIQGYSCTCDPTIISGKLPSEHGHLSFFSYAPDRSPFAWCRIFSLLPKFLSRRGRVRRYVSKFVQWVHGYTGYFQLYNVPFNYLHLFDYSEKRDIYQPGGLNEGVPTIFDHWRKNDVPFSLSDWRRSETDNLAKAVADIRQGEIQAAYVYLASLDGVMHGLGTKHEKIDEKIDWYDQQLRNLLAEGRETYDEVQLYIFSDHGMTDVHTDYDLIGKLESVGLKFNEDYAAMFDSTMARFWFLKEGVESRVREAINEDMMGRFLSMEDEKSEGIYFEDRRYGEAMYLLDPGVLMVPSFMGQIHIPGMHGYSPSDKDSVAFFGSTAALSSPPKRLDDLYELMLHETTDAVVPAAIA